MTSRIKAVIFDLDGVLVFTDRYHYLAWKQLADKLGIAFDVVKNKRLRGVSRMNSLEIILEGYRERTFSADEKKALADEKNMIYREYLGTMSEKDVTEDVRSTLIELRRRGYALAVGSSSKNARYILEVTRLTDMFDGISDGTNITKSKPDPEVFCKAAERIGAQPEECLVVEDAKAGIEAAKSAGMLAAGIGDAADYEGCDFRLERITDILKICV